MYNYAHNKVRMYYVLDLNTSGDDSPSSNWVNRHRTWATLARECLRQIRDGPLSTLPMMLRAHEQKVRRYARQDDNFHMPVRQVSYYYI